MRLFALGFDFFFGLFLLALGDKPGAPGSDSTQAQERKVRHAGDQAHDDQNRRCNCQRLGRGEHLPLNLRAHVLGSGNTGHHDGRRSRQQQRRNLRHQAVTNGQQHIDAARLGKRQTVLRHTNGQAAKYVDKQNQQAGNSVAADEFAGTVHGTVELGFLRHFPTTGLGLLLIDQARVQVGINGHLLAGHGIQGEARTDLGNAPRALGDHHKVDDHQDGEHHQTDNVVTADHHLTKGLNHLTGRVATLVAVQQHHAGGGHVQRQPQQRGDQQNGREYRKVQRPQCVGTDQQHHQRQRDVEGKEHVQQKWRNRQHHHAEHHQQQHRNPQAAVTQPGQIGPHVAHQLCAINSHWQKCPRIKYLTLFTYLPGTTQKAFQLFCTLCSLDGTPSTKRLSICHHAWAARAF